jgi:hypothetical protein
MAMELFVAQVAATLVMAGVIWFVQVVHYPLFARVGRAEFAAYEAEHTTRTSWVVGPPMLVEMVTATLALLPGLRPEFFPMWAAVAGEALVGVIWISTAALQVPLHRRLIQGFEAKAAARLVSSNWVRTMCWSLRAVLLLWVVARAL